MKNKIEDFGEKIEGARKDIAALRKGLMKFTTALADDWNDEEREQYITKDLVWKKPDYQKMYDEGTDRKIVYYIKTIRDALPVKPTSSKKEFQDRYIEFVSDIRDNVMKIKDSYDINEFLRRMMGKYLEKRGSRSYALKDKTYDCFQNKLLRVMQHYPTDIDIVKKEFLFTEDEKIINKHIRNVVHFEPKDKLYVDRNVYANGKEEGLIKIQHDKDMMVYTLPSLNKEVKSSNFVPDTFFVISKKGDLLCYNEKTKEDAMKKTLAYARMQEEKTGKKTTSSAKRKTKLLPPQLEHIERKGTEYRINDKNVTGEDILKKFGLRGGQFGNWTNQKDRQTSMNMLYDAFCDLAVALDIPYEDISLARTDNSRTAALGIAFGARGHSSALAHFESAENVINLTKMKGAGSLAHEWGHALDCYIKKELGLSSLFVSEQKQKQMATHCQDYNNPTVDLVETMKRKNDGRYIVSTDYEKDSKKADREYSKSDNGYWSSNCEMFARAFACYVKDKLEEKGIRSDYLCGHAEATIKPKGEERIAINKAFDYLFDDLKKRGLFKHQVHDVESEIKKTFPVRSKVEISDFADEQSEQFSLFDFTDNDTSPASDTPVTETFIDSLTFEYQSVGYADENERVLTMKVGMINELPESIQNIIKEKTQFEENDGFIFAEVFDDGKCLSASLYIKDNINNRYNAELSLKERTAIFKKTEYVLGYPVTKEFDRLYDTESVQKNVEYDDF